MPDQAKFAHAALSQRIIAVDTLVAGIAEESKPVVAFIEWPDPLYVGGHWTPQLIIRAGGLHPLNTPAAPGRGAGKSFPVPAAEILASDPDLVILCPCGLNMEATRKEAESMKR